MKNRLYYFVYNLFSKLSGKELCILKKAVLWLNRIVAVLTVIILIVVAGFTAPRLFGVKPFVVLSGSMEPTIPTGSCVFVNTKDRDVSEGDIITFSLSTGENTGVFVTHRVNKITDDGLIQTKGDNNDNPDGYLEKDAVVGTVIFHVPVLGQVLDFLQSKGFVLNALWVFVINIITMLLSWLVEHKHDSHASA